MADAIRTQADLLTRLADNNTGAISPQDVRDLMVSLQGQMAQVSVAGNAVETSIATVSTYTEADLTGATLSEQSSVIGSTDDFDMPATGRLRYLGATTRHFHISVSISFTAAGNNKEFHFRLAKNGTPSAEAEVRRKVGTGTDVGSTAIHWITSLAQNDVLALYAQNVSDDTNLTIVSANVQCVGMMV